MTPRSNSAIEPIGPSDQFAEMGYRTGEAVKGLKAGQ